MLAINFLCFSVFCESQNTEKHRKLMLLLLLLLKLMLLLLYTYMVSGDTLLPLLYGTAVPSTGRSRRTKLIAMNTLLVSSPTRQMNMCEGHLANITCHNSTPHFYTASLWDVLWQAVRVSKRRELFATADFSTKNLLALL